MKIFLASVILLAFAFEVFPQVSLDKNIALDPATNKIDVYLTTNSVEGWNVKSNWTVIAIDAANNVTKIDLHSIETVDGTMFSLVPSDRSTTSPIAHAAQLIVKFADKSLAVYKVKAPPPQPTVTPASSKQNSDLYLSFAFSPAIHSAPQYTIDSSVGLMFDLDKNDYKKGQLGFVGSVKTDKRKKVDPDSYRLFLAYQNTPVETPKGRLQGVMFTWLNGPEFDRKGHNVNFITAPYLDFPFRVFPKMIFPATEAMAVITPVLGIEVGRNFKNAVTGDDGRAVFRGVAGASGLLRFNPKLKGFKGVELTGAYTLRLPFAREIYTLTETVNGQDVDLPSLSKNPRHYVKTEAALKITDAFALSFKYEYGAIPPVFRKQDHKVTVGFTYGIRQILGGVASSLRNK